VVTVALGLLVAGIYAWTRQLTGGEVVTGLGDIGAGGATWGLYVIFLVYFISVSFGGIAVAALIRLLDVRELRPVARMAELIAIISILLGALVVIIDLGQPLRGFVNLWLYARPGSPFFYTFSMVISGYLFASLVFFYLAGRKDAAICARCPGRLQWFHRLWAAGYRDTPAERRRHQHVSWWLALAILPFLVIAHSVLGFVFGSQGAQPGWFSALQVPGFVVMAGIAGLGLVIVVSAIARKALHLEDQIGEPVFRWLGRLLGILLIIFVYLLAAELLTAGYASPEGESTVLRTVLTGQYAWAFWSSIGVLGFSLWAILSQWLRGKYSIPLLVTVGVAANVLNVLKRYILVVPSQTDGSALPYLEGSYSPTWVEYLVIAGIAALGVLLFMGFTKLFPIVEIPEKAEGGA
jgi:molybdopterin-containing oxidoreductase family membrane subunit